MSRRTRQLTYWQPPEPEQPETPPEPRSDALWGYALRDIDDLAVRVVRNHMHWWPAGDREDQHDTAWMGIAEHLAAALEMPTERDLLEAGRSALSREVKAVMRHRGAGSHNDIPNAGARFAAFWWSHASVAQSHERAIVERTALSQALAALTPRQRDALNALALYGDYWQAAAALGIENQTFRSLIGRARRVFFRLWYEHETPPRIKGTDKRVERHETDDPKVLARRARDAERARAKRAALKATADREAA